MYPEISEAERFPLLTPAGRKLLHAMRQHPNSPIWNWPNGEQLNAEGLARVRQFATELTVPPSADSTGKPAWLPKFVDFCLEDVPFYRRRSSPGTAFTSIPSVCRDDLAPKVWEFVPNSQPLDELIIFSSSGTTGHPAQMPTHPATAACGIPLLERAIASTDVHLPRGPEQMALSNITAYRGAYTTAIVVAFLEQAGCIRVNLSPDAWRRPGDCQTYLDRWHAPVMLGDPQAFAALADVPIENRPQVMVSSIMTLSDALAGQLTARYGCPVIDMYALTEAGIVGVKTAHGHVVLPHDLYVEILDENDAPCPPGVRGEVTLTGGRNPFLPLLRYRTGDYASLESQQGRPLLVDLEGREPVEFPLAGDRVIHSMEVTRTLRKFPLVQYQLNQDADGDFSFRYRGGVPEEMLRDALHDLLGGTSTLSIEKLPPPTAGRHVKMTAYRSALVQKPSHSS